MSKNLYISAINVFFEGFQRLTDRERKKTQVTEKTTLHSSCHLSRLPGKKADDIFPVTTT